MPISLAATASTDDSAEHAKRGQVSLHLFATTLIAVGAVYALALLITIVTHSLGWLTFEAILLAASLLQAIFTLVIFCLPAHQHRSFGYANVVTSVRAAMVCFIAGVVLFPVDRIFSCVLVAAVAAVALVLDGLDGRLARHYRQQSALGTRFDLEIDALQIFLMATAVFLFEKAGWWVLIVGLMRYLFVLASYWQPRLRGPLPSSRRRKLVRVLLTIALCVALVPQVAPEHSTPLVAGALAILGWSFGVDVLYLLWIRDREK